MTTPDGSFTSSAYSGSGSYDQTLITDPAGNQRELYTDALGHLGQVYAPGPSPYTPADYTTNYTYSVLDDLTGVLTSQTPRNRSFAYDDLGRLTSATNPENGTVLYSSYDKNGNLLTKTANGITTTYSYDVLNRLTNKSYSDGQTAPVTYTYDTAETSATPNYYVGRLSLVSTAALVSLPATTTTYAQYDANGRVVASAQTIGTQTPFSFSYTYNDLSLDTETYPSSRQLETCYDSAARVSQVLNLSASGNPAYASLSYNLAGGTATTTNTMGNHLVETDTTNTRLQTQTILVGTSPNSVGEKLFGSSGRTRTYNISVNSRATGALEIYDGVLSGITFNMIQDRGGSLTVP